jgi:tetratricopeptide (TPR) repeat protein
MATTAARNRQIDEAIEATREEDYLRAYTLFLEIYGSEDAPPSDDPKAVTGLSYFGLCVALVQKKYKPAIDLCRRALDLQFYNVEHYLNLAKVYVAGGNRKKAVEIAEEGLKGHRDYTPLVEFRKTLGIRSRPAVPFLDRSHPINVTLGQARAAKKKKT